MQGFFKAEGFVDPTKPGAVYAALGGLISRQTAYNWDAASWVQFLPTEVASRGFCGVGSYDVQSAQVLLIAIPSLQAGARRYAAWMKAAGYAARGVTDVTASSPQPRMLVTR